MDRRGIPLLVVLSPANRHDSQMLEPVLDAIRPIKDLGGRPCKRPDKLHADKAYNVAHYPDACHKLGLACRGIESSEKLGRHR